MTLAITILVGTMTGTADLVADEVTDWIEGQGGRVERKPMDRLGAEVFRPGGLYLLCTSTYGQGDVPDNARDFFKALETARPDLTGVGFGLIGLGDSTYQDTYCYGGKRFEALLKELGATLVGEPLYHDAASGTLPEEEAVGWVEGWAEAVPEPLRKAA